MGLDSTYESKLGDNMGEPESTGEKCAICRSPNRIAIESMLLDGSKSPIIRSRYPEVTAWAASVHKRRCIGMRVQAAVTAQVVQAGINSLAVAEDVVHQAERLGKLAEGEKQYATALKAQRERARGVELYARLRGEIDNGSGPLNDARWFRIRDIVYEVLSEYPGAPEKFMARLVGLARPVRAELPQSSETVNPSTETDE